MGRRINISQPTVINTELVPLTDSFALEPNGQTEQWYYENDGTYATDRRIVPLVITPKLSAFDKDTNQTYSPNISTIAWYASQWTNGKWVETEITNISDASQDYYIRQDKALQVSKNLSDAAHGVTIRCVATFIDPRDAGITYTEEDTIQLTANKDATVFYPDVDILNETTVTFNPLVDENSHKVFKGKIDWTTITRLNPDIAEYYINPSGTEQMLPDNASDVMSLSPILDIRYGRGATVSWNQLFTYRQTANGTMDVERTLTWNQLVQNGNFSNGTTGWSGSGFIADADGLELERNAVATQAFPNYNPSHRYYLTAEGFGADAILCVAVAPSTHAYSVGEIFITRKNVSTRDSTIVEGECEDAELGISSMAGNSTAKYVMLVDLTLMYGAGNEPSTTAQFEEDFRTIFGKDIEYMPYNEGETVRIASLAEGMASVRRIQGQSVVWNRIINLREYTITDNGITATYDAATHSFEMSGTSTSGADIAFQDGRFKMQEGHSYLFYLGKISSTGSTHGRLYIRDTNKAYVIFTVNITESYAEKQIIVSSDDYETVSYYLNVGAAGATISGTITPIAFDLTLMFGYGNEPATVEEFEAWLAANVGLRDYYPYNEGTILGVKCTGIKTVGENLFDGTWEEGWLDSTGQEESGQSNQRRTPYFNIPPSDLTQSYKTLGIGGGRLFFYDKNKQYISSAIIDAEMISTVPNGARYVRMRATTSNITQEALFTTNINLRTYVPYKEYTSPMEVVTMKGKLNGQGISTIVFPNGMNSIGDIYDEIYVEDNTLKAVKRLGVVDLGTLNWTKASDGTYARYYSSGIASIVKPPVSSVDDIPNILSPKYEVVTFNQAYRASIDKVISITNVPSEAAGNVNVVDSTYSDAATFKTGMNGVMLVYELATPEEYVLDPTVDARYFEWYGVKNGAEVKIDTLPCYVSGQGTDTLTIDAMFGENIPVVLRAKRYPWSDSLYPSKAYRNMAWRIPNIDAIVASDRGQAVHSDNDGGYEFDTIINIKKAILDEETKNKHLRFKWWMRNTRNNQAVETSVGWGSQVGIGVEDLRNVRGANNSLASTPVYNEVMLLGAYEEVSYTIGNATEYVTYNGVQLFGRTLE